MASLTIDHDGIEPIVSAPRKMDSLDVDAISVSEWKQFANNMQIFDPKEMQRVAESLNPNLVRRFFSVDMAPRNLHEVAKLGKIDVMKVLLSLRNRDVNKIDKASRTALHYATREGHLEIVTMLLAEKNINASLCDGDQNTALHYAAKHGHVLVFEMLLRVAPKVDINITNRSGNTPLLLAAGRGHEKIVDMLLEEPKLEVTSEDHYTTPLHEAARYGRAIIVEKLLQRMDVNSTNDLWKQSPLHLAVEGDHEAVVDLLLGAPTVNPSLKDNVLGQTPLHIAAENGNEVILEKLLQRPEVDVNGGDHTRTTALHFAAENKHANIVKKLLEKPNVDPCPKTTEGDTTPLHIATKVSAANVVQVLLAIGKVDVNITDSKKRTAIRWATKRGQFDVVDMLLRVPTVAPYLGDDNGDTPLHLAAKFGHKDIAERLLVVPHLDMVNKVNKQNETPLFLAAKHGFVDLVDFLLGNPKVDWEVDLSICDEHGDSPFHVAVKGGYANIAQKLITHPRAVPIHTNQENLIAFHLCIRGGHKKLVDILLKQSTIDASAKDASGNFPIHYAAQHENTSMLQMILNAPGVDVNSINDHRDTALHIAVKAGHVDVVALLLQVPTLNASMQDRDGNSALHVAAKYGVEEIIEKLLKVGGVDVNAKDEDGVTALELAIEEGHGHVFEKLLEVQNVLNNEGDGSAKEAQKKPSKTDWAVRSLLLAARNGHDTIIKSLLTLGVDVNGTDKWNGPALSEAIEHGHTKVAELLLNDPKIDPNKSWYQEHPLFIAVRYGQIAIVEKLMATRQIDVNVLSNGETALHRATEEGREQVVKILLNTPGIDVHIKDKNNETALFYAAKADNKIIMKDIYYASKVDFGSENHNVQTQLNIDDKNNGGESIIHLAARKNLLNVIDFLLEVVHDDVRSVDVNLKTSPPKDEEDGFISESALEIAINAKNYTFVEKLTKFDSISFKQEEDGKKVFQQIFKKKQWEAFNILKRTPEVKDYIDALYKDRQANVDAANAILVGAALIASVTFASWLQPPLGYATYYHEQFSDSLPAPPVAYPDYASFDHHPSLQAFWVFNSLSFFSAIATVISGARSVLPAEKVFIKQEVENLRRNLLKTSILLCFSMFFVLLAFATAGVVVLPPVMKFRANIFSTIGIGGSVCFIFLFLFGINIYKLVFDIKSSQASKKGFLERWESKTWHMQNLFRRSSGDTVDTD